MPQTFDRGKSIEGNTSAGRPLPVDMDKGKHQVGPKKRKVEMVVEIPEITIVHSPKKQDQHQATHSSKLFENDLPKPSTEDLASTSG
jgi:hypothetical protein